MSTLYLWLDIGSLLVPFLFSFHPKIQFYRKWKSFLMGTLVMMLFFIPWDILFTQNGFWGFNTNYLTGIYFLGLPLEEWLFFFCIPYACLFTHEALKKLAPKFVFTEKGTQILYLLLQSVLIVCLWYQYDQWYTFVCFFYGMVVLGLTYNLRPSILPHFFTSYLVILLPFFVVNGILTGSFIDEPVVWYRNAETLGIRLWTIPLEDTLYNLGMLLTVLLAMELFTSKAEVRAR